MINNFGNIYLAYNNHIEIINHNNSKNNEIKIITWKELLLELSSFEAKTLNYFFDHGLNKNINESANITLILTTMRNKTKLESHDFSYKDSHKKLIYDVPYYHKNVPEGFSVFCTDEEFDLVMSYVKKKEENYNKNKIKEKEKVEINLVSEPEPSKKNFICQLCRSRFDNYKEHILSEGHCKNIKKHKNSFNKLSLTFKRITRNSSYDINNNIYKTPKKKEFNLGKEKSKENSYIKSLSSLLTNESNNLIEFSPEDFRKINKYNLRVKKSPSFGKDNNDNYCYYNYFTSSSKNNNIRIIKNENDVNSPQQQVSSTTSSTYKNIYIEESETNKSTMKLNHKRKREDIKEKNIPKTFIEQLNSKNKKQKIK